MIACDLCFCGHGLFLENGHWNSICVHIGGLQHKCAMSTKLFVSKSQRYKGRMSYYVDIQHLCFWHRHVLWLLLTKITIFCNDVNKTSTSIELLAINALCYKSQRSNVGLGIKSTAGRKTFVEEFNASTQVWWTASRTASIKSLFFVSITN